MSNNGKPDDGGGCSYTMVIITEALIFLPTCIYSAITYMRIAGRVTCNTSAELELVLVLQFVSSLIIMACLAPCVVEKITSCDDYFRGLAEFHNSHLHKLVQFHILFDWFIIVYGIIAVITTNDELCSSILPRTVTKLLFLHGFTVSFRTLQHMVFPAIVHCYAKLHPMADIPDPALVKGGTMGNDEVDEKERHAERVRKIVDYNFHVVQEAFVYRERLPPLVDPNPPLKVKNNKTNNKKLLKRESSTILVKPKSIKQVIPL